MLLALTLPAAAWTVDTTDIGTPVRWDTMPVPWMYAADDAPALDGVAGAIAAAFETWEDIDGVEVLFQHEQPEDGTRATANDGANLVWWDDRWPEHETALALTTTYTSGDGVLLGFDVRIDTSTVWSTVGDPDAYDLQAAITHEIGHALGLEHSGLPDATMYGLHGRGEDWRRVLHTDDEDAARFLYSTNEPPRDRDEPYGNVVEAWSCSTPGSPTSGAIAPAIGVLFAFRFSRKQRQIRGGARIG